PSSVSPVSLHDARPIFILFAGIVARLPVTLGTVWQYMQLGIESASTAGQYLVLAPLFVVLFLVVIWVIVFMNEAERRIPVQYAKDRKSTRLNSSHVSIS